MVNCNVYSCCCITGIFVKRYSRLTSNDHSLNFCRDTPVKSDYTSCITRYTQKRFTSMARRWQKTKDESSVDVSIPSSSHPKQKQEDKRDSAAGCWTLWERNTKKRRCFREASCLSSPLVSTLVLFWLQKEKKEQARLLDQETETGPKLEADFKYQISLLVKSIKSLCIHNQYQNRE